MARDAGVPVLPGTDCPATVDDARTLLSSLGGRPIMIKAVAGGRRSRHAPCHRSRWPRRALRPGSSEAGAALGDARVYVEAVMPGARHVEVQVVGDGHDVVHLWDRECSLQRQRQKIVEVAGSMTTTPMPAPSNADRAP